MNFFSHLISQLFCVKISIVCICECKVEEGSCLLSKWCFKMGLFLWNYVTRSVILGLQYIYPLTILHISISANTLSQLCIFFRNIWRLLTYCTLTKGPTNYLTQSLQSTLRFVLSFDCKFFSIYRKNQLQLQYCFSWGLLQSPCQVSS